MSKHGCTECKYWHDKYVDACEELQHRDMTMPIAEEIADMPMGQVYIPHAAYKVEQVVGMSRKIQSLEKKLEIAIKASESRSALGCPICIEAIKQLKEIDNEKKY